MEEIAKIIGKRKKGSLAAVIICILIIVAMAWQSDSGNGQMDLGLIAGGCAILFLLICLYAVNSFNYPVPKSYYRRFNKIVYIYLGKVGVILSFLSALWNLKRFLNPMEGYAHPDDKSDDLLNAGLDIAAGQIISKNVRTAERVEQLYKLEESKVVSINPETQAPVNPPPVFPTPST